MKNYIQDGDSLTLTAPSGGVVSGGLYIIKALAVVAAGDAKEGESFVGKRMGVFELPKSNSAPNQGAAAYWSAANSNTTTVATDNTKIGVFAAPAIAGEATAQVLLTGHPV